MASEQKDYSQIFDFLYRIDRRIGYLEKDARFIEREILNLEGKKSKKSDDLDEELKRLHSEIVSLRGGFSVCIHEMSLLSKGLKDAVKTDDMQGLNSRLDELPFEEFVTQKDLERGI